MITRLREAVALARDLILAAGVLIAGAAVAIFFIVRKRVEDAAKIATISEEAKNEAATNEISTLAAAGDAKALRKRRLAELKEVLAARKGEE